MLEFLKEIQQTDYDTVFFVPGVKKDSISIEGSRYKDRGDKIGGNDVGDEFHIIIFKEDENGEMIHLDKFDAILGEPLEYISTLIPQDWYGMIARKTTTSSDIMDSLFENLTN